MHQFLLGGGGKSYRYKNPQPLVYKTGQWKASYSATHPDQTHVMLIGNWNKMVLCTLIYLNLHEIGFVVILGHELQKLSSYKLYKASCDENRLNSREGFSP